MNPALIEMYLANKGMQVPGIHGDFVPGYDRYGIEHDFMRQYNIPTREEILQHAQSVPVPGTRGMVQAPQLPAPAAVQPSVIMEEAPPKDVDEEYERYGTMHGIVPAPYSSYENDNAPNLEGGYSGGSGGAQQELSPIQKGANAAVQASRQSYEMDEDQRRRALGLAMMGFFSKYAASQNPSNLGALNESFSPAVDAFVSERDKMTNLNRQMQQDERKMQRDQFDKDIALQRLELAKQTAARQAARTGKDGLTEYQRFQMEKHQHHLNSAYIDLQRKQEQELNTFVKNASKTKFGKKLDEAVAQKEAQIQKKYARAMRNLEIQMEKWGMGEPTQDTDLDGVSVAPVEDQEIDWENLSDEELMELAGE